MKTFFTSLFALGVVGTAILGFTVPTQAQVQLETGSAIGKQLEAAGGKDGAGLVLEADPRRVVLRIITIVLSLIGTILFSLMVYSGFLWMTAGGNEEQVAQAKTTIRNCIMGLLIILMSYTITLAVTNLAMGRDVGSDATNNNGGTLEGAIQGCAGDWTGCWW